MIYPVVNPYRPADDSYYPLRVVFFIGLMLMGYLLSEPNREKDNMKIDTGTIDSLDPLPWQRTASRKAVERYADAQERKWRRWNEAMFERKS